MEVVCGKLRNRIRRSRKSGALGIDQCRDLAVHAWFRHGGGGDDYEEALRRCEFDLSDGHELAIELRADAWPTLRRERERRALGDNPMTLTTTSGGYLVPPGGFHDTFEAALLSTCPFLELAEVIITAQGGAYPVPTVNDTANGGAVVAVNASRGEGSAVTVGRLVLGAHWLSSEKLLIPYELTEDAPRFIEWVAVMLGQRVGRLIGDKCTNGTGSGEPAGILTGATLGVTSASATAVTADELTRLVCSVDASYRNELYNCGWLMHNDIMLALMQMKGGQGHYLFPELRQREPQLIGFPVHLDNDLASTCAAGGKPILFGGLKSYKIRVVGDVTVNRVQPKVYVNSTDRAAEDQDMYEAVLRLDSGVADAGTHPIKYLQMHA